MGVWALLGLGPSDVLEGAVIIEKGFSAWGAVEAEELMLPNRA